MKNNVIVIHEKDNVAIALADIKKGEKVLLPGSGEFPAMSDIPYSHKVSLKDLASGDNIIKYGEIIGQAKDPIRRGDWIHTHNLIVEGS